MTTKVKQIVTNDLYTAVDTLKFDREEIIKYVETVPELSAVTFLVTKVGPMDSLTDLVQACSEEISPFLTKHHLNDYRIWLFVADGPWQPDNRLIRYKKLWKRDYRLKPFLDTSNKSDQVEILSDLGIRYAGLIELPNRDKLLHAVELTRKDPASCIILSNRSDICSHEALKSIFFSAFPKGKKGYEDTEINWFSLAAGLCPKGDFIVRISGLFDDREASIDIIFDKKTIPDKLDL